MASLFQKLTRLLADPVPDFVFEVTEAGLAYARPGAATPPVMVPLEPGILSISPLDTPLNAVKGYVAMEARKNEKTSKA